jgi:hypothetical protein
MTIMSFTGPRRTLLLAATIVTAACQSLDAPDQNAISLDGLTTAPTPASVAAATQDLIVGFRQKTASMTSTFGILGREGYNLDPGNLQNVQQYFVALGDIAIWSGPYRMLKLADMVDVAVDKVAALSATQKAGYHGFIATAKAFQLLAVIRCVDASGAAIDAASGPTDSLPPIVDKAAVYTAIDQLLDNGQTALQAAGATFAFSLGTGFAGFETPATFLRFNRALRARADIDVGSYSQALTDLAASFLDTTKPMTYGPVATYSTAAGDAQNPLYEAQPRVYFAHPSLATNAQKKADGSLDNRFVSKVKATTSVTRAGVTTAWTFQIYSGPTAAIPIIRNEELILLHAEASLGLNNTASAISDINIVRASSGGLAPISSPYAASAGQPATLLDELLYEKRYSLLWEVGTTWLDARHYGELAALPHDAAGFVVFPYTRIPDAECQARRNAPAGCVSPKGL